MEYDPQKDMMEAISVSERMEEYEDIGVFESI